MSRTEGQPQPEQPEDEQPASENQPETTEQPGGPEAATPGGNAKGKSPAFLLRERFAAVASQALRQGGKVPRVERFDKFTERAKKVLVLAQQEAQRFNHNYIGTEHLLLGLVREGEGIGAKVLTNMGIELEQARSAVEFIIGRGDKKVSGDISLTPRSKKVIELAVDEARRLNHNYVGTEHLLLGMVREGEGIAAGVLQSLGANLEEVRANVLRVVTQQAPTAQPVTTKDNVVSCRVDGADLDAIDMLVEAGIRSTRSEAAQWLIHAGIAANKELFAKVEGTVGEIRRLRDEARRAAWQVAGDTESLLNTTPSEEPRPGGGKGDHPGAAAPPSPAK